MAVAKLNISKSGVSGILVLGMFKDHTWHLESPVSWFPATSGEWFRQRNATKFRQFSFLRVMDEKGQSIADFPEPPYTNLQKFTASLISRCWIFETSLGGDPFDVEVKQCPPPTKDFALRETWASSLSSMKRKDGARSPPTTLKIPKLGISECIPLTEYCPFRANP